MSSLQRAATAVRVIQLTDSHLGDRPHTRLLNLDTEHSLAAVLRLVDCEQPRIDALLATGDLADRGSVTAYRRFAEATAKLCARLPQDAGEPCRWLPGNHDEWQSIRSVLGAGHVRLQPQLLLEGWQVIMLDSTIPGEVGGNLTLSQLEMLRGYLEAEPERYALICLHHHVLPVGAAWLDEQRVANADHLLAELAQFPQVRGLLSGHVHQASEVTCDGLRLFTSPSTCVQFAANSREFQIDAEAAPGYRWLDLHPDGRITSGVSRVRDMQFPVDASAVGY